MKPASAAVTGMARSEDPVTSVKAAETVSRRKWTLREKVEDFARRCPHGFLDEEVGMLDPDAPESSLRKRRTELADENIILATDETRINSKGQPCIVWRHRMHTYNPPPQKAREAKPSRFTLLQEENARLRSELDEARQPERIAVVSFLHRCEKAIDEQRIKYEESGSHRQARLLLQEKDAYANAASMIERGEHRR